MNETGHNSAKENELATAPVGKLLFKLAVPCVAAQVVNALYNLVDRIYIGHLPETGSLALAALGICYPIIMVISAFAALIGNGGAPRASIAMGSDREEDAQRILGTCFTTMVIVSLALTGIFEAAARPMLIAFGATEAMLPHALSYLRVYLMGTLSVQLTLSMNAFITAQGFTTVSMKTTLIGAVINIILDPIFIFLLNMGVRGAALASVLAQTCSAVWVMVFLLGKRTHLRIQRSYMIPRLKILLPVLALGIAPFIMQATESAVQSCFNIQMRAYGGAEADTLIAGTSIMLSTLQFIILPAMGLGQGAQPITSFNYGAGCYDRVKTNFFLLLRSCAIYMMILVGLCVIYPGAVGSVFTSDEATLAVVKEWMPTFIIGMGTCWMLFACQNTFLALGQAVRSLCIAMLRKILLLIPLIFLLPCFLGVRGIILAEPIADVCASVAAITVFWQFSRKIFVYNAE